MPDCTIRTRDLIPTINQRDAYDVVQSRFLMIDVFSRPLPHQLEFFERLPSTLLGRTRDRAQNSAYLDAKNNHFYVLRQLNGVDNYFGPFDLDLPEKAIRARFEAVVSQLASKPAATVPASEFDRLYLRRSPEGDQYFAHYDTDRKAFYVEVENPRARTPALYGPFPIDATPVVVGGGASAPAMNDSVREHFFAAPDAYQSSPMRGAPSVSNLESIYLGGSGGGMQLTAEISAATRTYYVREVNGNAVKWYGPFVVGQAVDSFRP